MDQGKESVSTYFSGIVEQYAEQYDHAASLRQYPADAVRARKALDLLQGLAPSGTVLDAGCGTGHVSAQLLGLGYDVVGMDISPEMVRQAEARTGSSTRARFFVGDVEHLSLPDGSVDAALALGVLEFLADPSSALSEIRRVLRRDGIAVVAFRNRLFNLFSMNDYTQREVDAGEYGKLLAELRAETGREDASSLPLEAYARELAAPTESMLPGEAGHDDTVVKLGPPPVELGQHTPEEARQAAARHGLELIELVYFHFHPLPPVWERNDPETFNRLALAMEVLDRTAVGALMASAFVGAFRAV